jgi:hypothetical protein
MVFFCGGGGKPDCTQATSGTAKGTITAADITGQRRKASTRLQPDNSQT